MSLLFAAVVQLKHTPRTLCIQTRRKSNIKLAKTFRGARASRKRSSAFQLSIRGSSSSSSHDTSVVIIIIHALHENDDDELHFISPPVHVYA